VLSGRGLCDGLITRQEESYRLWCVVVCDLENSRMRRPWSALGRSATKKNIYIYITLVGLLHVLAYLGIPWYAETCSRSTSVCYVHILMRVIKTNIVSNFTKIGQ